MLMPGSGSSGALLPLDLLFPFTAAISSFISQARAAVVIFESSMNLLSRSLNSVGL
jgi:hypothetical protein